ncbi:hypothetical protein N0V93_004641 [Gnomoniopsis smithogilvyi]|uniref:Uncharacterized protein n=1 Tax=Gnomoniopsis smithogilvyi TaxID=1191159 RepID=A0A9W8YT79_9PEZI|nr:hypothetical protein N0V93_004641 [Gnomoniopsis smithogilvyi]
MFKYLFTLAFLLPFIAQCLAEYQPVTTSQQMTVIGTGTTTSWVQELDVSAHYSDTITYSQLLQIANMGWNWLRIQPYSWKKGNKNCLVAALWVPGGRVYIGSIARGDRLTAMKANGPTMAPVWYEMKTEPANHAEDNVLYQFESDQTRNGRTDGNGLMMATYGSFRGSSDTVGSPINPCSSCKMTSSKLEVNYFDRNLVNLPNEPENVAKRAVKKATTSKKAPTSAKATTSVKTSTSAKTTPSAKTTSSAPVKTTSATATSGSGSQTASTSSQESSESLTSAVATTLSTITTSAQSGSTVAEPTIKKVPFTYSLSDQPSFDKRIAAPTEIAAF